MAKIKTESKPLPPPRSLFRFRPKGWLSLLIIASLGIGAHFLWKYRGPQIAQESHYSITEENIFITPPPTWIRTDIKTQALRDSGLVGTLSVLDDWDTLARRVKDAFQFHPWVESVQRVERKLPRSLVVELVYRSPVAAVESSDPSGIMYLPIDKNGVRLPEVDFSDAQRRHLPRISGITGRPLVGDQWDDVRVTGGAKLAVYLADVWQKLRLVEIIASLQSTPRDEKPRYRFDLVTSGGTRIVWGMMPGDEAASGESPFAEKRQRLLDYATQYGKLESAIDGPEMLDVRKELVVTPRTARHKKTVPGDETTQTK
jgi:hypothetical protein